MEEQEKLNKGKTYPPITIGKPTAFDKIRTKPPAKKQQTGKKES